MRKKDGNLSIIRDLVASRTDSDIMRIYFQYNTLLRFDIDSL